PLGRFTSDPPAFFARAPLSGSAHQQYMSMVPSGKKHGSNWAARMRINMSAPVDGERGGQVRYQMAHAHDRFIPASKYLESHPEFFALVNGQRGRSRSKPQLCYSNPELQKEFARNLIRYARENPHLLSIGIDPNDGTSAANMCQCDG